MASSIRGPAGTETGTSYACTSATKPGLAVFGSLPALLPREFLWSKTCRCRTAKLSRRHDMRRFRVSTLTLAQGRQGSTYLGFRVEGLEHFANQTSCLSPCHSRELLVGAAMRPVVLSLPLSSKGPKSRDSPIPRLAYDDLPVPSAGPRAPNS